MKTTKPKNEPKPILTSIFIREKSTGNIILQFPPTQAGERRAEHYRYLMDLEIVKIYSKGG